MTKQQHQGTENEKSDKKENPREKKGVEVENTKSKKSG